MTTSQLAFLTDQSLQCKCQKVSGFTPNRQDCNLFIIIDYNDYNISLELMIKDKIICFSGLFDKMTTHFDIH